MSLSVLNRGGVSKGGLTGIIQVNGLSETDIVTASKDGVVKSGKWVATLNPECVVPDGYAQLEYIQSNGDQYINSGLPSSDNMRIVATAYQVAQENGSSFFGGDPHKPYGGALYCSDGQMKLYCGQTGGIVAGTVPYGTWFNFDITIKNGSVSVDWDGANSSGTYSGNIGTTENFFVFSAANGVEKTKGLRYQRFKWTRNGSVVRDYIPAKQKSDGAIGFYDLANSVFYPNAGTGTFIAGAEVPKYMGYHEITGIKDTGVWAVTATNGAETATQDVLIEVIGIYNIQMNLS